MNLRDLLGDEFRENMSVSEIEAILADKNLVDPSTLPKSVDKSVFDKTSSDLSKAKKRIKELEANSLTADEKIQQAISEAEEAKKDFLRKTSHLEVEKVFVANGISENAYKDIIYGIISEDKEASVSLANKLADLIVQTRQQTEKQVKADLLKKTPEPGGSGGSAEELAKKFASMTLTEKAKFKVEHPEEYGMLKDMKEGE